MNTIVLRTTQMCLLLLAAALGFPTSPGPALGQTGAPPAAIVGVELRKAGEQQQVHFLVQGESAYELAANLRKRVLVVKFPETRLALPGGRRHLAFNDPMITGIAFEQVGENTTWAKVLLRVSNLRYEPVGDAPPHRVVVAFRVSTDPLPIELTTVRLGRHRNASRVVLDLTRLPRYQAQMDGAEYVVRLSGVEARPGLRFSGEDERLRLKTLESRGNDTVLRIELRKATLQPAATVLPDPPRVVLNFTETDTPAPQPAMATAAPKAPAPPPRADPLEELLAAEADPLVRANYILAERAFRAGNYTRANNVFLRVYNTAPQARLGIRALFRSADAQYELLRASGASNFHGLIANYQSATRAAEAANYDSALIPRAFFQIGRSYQQMGFHFEANVHFEILQQRFPENFPYTPDSFYYRGVAFVDMNRLDEAVQSFRRFLDGEGDPALEAAAYYHMGDAFYQAGKYVDAKREFEAGRKLEADYPQTLPVLLFHMGETYYENADFESARSIYHTLVQRYPEKPYTKLVALRLGDFLRDEGKEEDALRTYRTVLQNSPPELVLRGKLRIAGIYADRPTGDFFQQAIKLYDEVLAAEDPPPLMQQALLLKGLTQTQHHQNLEAIATLETLARRYPKSPLVRENLIDANIAENFKHLIDTLYAQKKFWEVAKIYTRFRDAHFRDFRFNFTLFQVASAYHALGLYDEATALYKTLTESVPGSLGPLVRLRHAQANIERDNLGAAEEQLLRFIQDYDPELYRTDARLELGKVYFQGRRYSEAMRAFQLIVREFEDKRPAELAEAISETYYQLGRVNKELGQHKDAGEAFRQAIDNFHYPIQGEVVPEFVVLSHFLMGDALFELGENNAAVGAYEVAINLYPDHEKAPWARYQIGLIYRRTGANQKALDVFNGLVDLAKTRPGEMWESLAKENQRDLVNLLQFREYLKQ